MLGEWDCCSVQPIGGGIRPAVHGRYWPRVAGYVSAEQYRYSVELLWRDGYIGPNGTHLHDGWFLFKPAYGSLLAVNLLGLAGNIFLVVACVACAQLLLDAEQRERAFRRQARFCRQCGHDLRRNDSNPHPECGTQDESSSR